MIRFVSGISFLYLFVILLLVWYGLVFYRRFVKNGYQLRMFPWVFMLVTAACMAFLYFNIHPLKGAAAFSNLDHYFIRHDGFRAGTAVELGKTDTSAGRDKPYSIFRFEKKGPALTVSSVYSEEPFYISSGGNVKLASANFPADGHSFSLESDSVTVAVSRSTEYAELLINNTVTGRSYRKVERGISLWHLFSDDSVLLNSPWQANEIVIATLKNVWLLRDNFSENSSGQLKYFVSGRLFRIADRIKFDEKIITEGNLAFTATIPDGSVTGWGAGFPGGNKNRFRVQYDTGSSYRLLNRYPVSYPLTEEPGKELSHTKGSYPVTKFLIANAEQIDGLPGVFNEGFLFSSLDHDSSTGFSPVLLSYYKDHSDAPLLLKARPVNNISHEIGVNNGKLVLPADTPGLQWEFSIADTFNWRFGNVTCSMQRWQLYMFGSLLFLFILVFISSFLKPADKQSWVWQLLSVVVMVLLTTRFFLYWRYKSFPPYDGLDLPSVQQLNNFWNFGIIIIAAFLFAVLLGFSCIRYLYSQSSLAIRKLVNPKTAGKSGSKTAFPGSADNAADDLLKRVHITKLRFFGAWLLILAAAGFFAILKHFDTSVSRHLAIIMVLVYFVFVYLSYRFSPLVTAREKSWWHIDTGKTTDIIISNPAKLLLSVSMLGFFLFIDIGFGLVFFNFLLFNEAFLFINYSIAGLSAGSRRNASLFGAAGLACLLIFLANLLYGPYLFRYLLDLPQYLYATGYLFFAVFMVYAAGRLFTKRLRYRKLAGIAAAALLFAIGYVFFPKERIQQKADITKYRIDVLTTPTGKVIEKAYEAGDNYDPVIRAAQNQWFINTFIHEENNPSVNSPVFHLVPHAPQNRGAKYNAQATDLVTSRFLIAEHGRWSVVFFVLLLLLPAALLASFYKLYPDFTNRINGTYATVITGFSILNYLLITALLVILAATGRYIFFGQDLPFGSILSKQSVLFPSMLIMLVVLLFRNLPLQQYPNRGKLLPGLVVFTSLAALLFFVKPAFNKNKEFDVAGLAENMDNFVQLHIQPLLDETGSLAGPKRMSFFEKDRLFTSNLYALLQSGKLDEAGPFIKNELLKYCRRDFSGHIDQSKLLYLDLHTGSAQLAVNENYFHVEPPPHLQQKWAGNVYGDSSSYNVSIWDAGSGLIYDRRNTSYTGERSFTAGGTLEFSFARQMGENLFEGFCMINRSDSVITVRADNGEIYLKKGDTLRLNNPQRIILSGERGRSDRLITIQPDAFMRNYFVNGGRYYHYPMGRHYIWARNFAEGISSEFAGKEKAGKNIFLSTNYELTDSLSAGINRMLTADTAYKKGAEYAICIADGNGRLITMPDYIKGYERPDPNDKAAFNSAVRGENGFITQSELRRKTGNINLLRMKPGPGSTLKPIVFSAVASQLPLDWDAFAAEGFSEKQHFFGGEKVTDYDFEKNNGRINSVADYIKYSDNYYHSNVLLLGSYSRQNLQELLLKHFSRENPGDGLHWPWFTYKGNQYWLNGFQNWPGYVSGKANFGSDSSFVSAGLSSNYGIHTCKNGSSTDRFCPAYDSALFGNVYRKSGFVFPEYALFDQKGEGMNMNRPNEVFISSFRGHVKGSSQVMIPPVKMLDAFGKLATQSRSYSVTLNPYATERPFVPFELDNAVSPAGFLSLMKGSVFKGMKEALYGGTAARLGSMLKNGSPYYYYAKTGTTGDEESKTKSKLFAIIISEKEMDKPGFNFRKNKFFIIYFTSQNGPAKQNEEFQAAVIRMVESSAAFKMYMEEK